MTKRLCVPTMALLFVAATAAAQDKAFRFPEAKHGKGELKYVQGIPVLVLSGTPEEMGEQLGALAIRHVDLNKLRDSVLNEIGLSSLRGLMTTAGKGLYHGFPSHHAKELEAAVKAGKCERDTAILANTLADLSAGFGCSTIIVEPARSKTGQPIFGRNFDWPPAPGLTDNILVTVYRPEKKHAFATVTITSLIGCISGINDAGLAVTINEIHYANDVKGRQFNAKGTPLLLAYRRVLEECSTVAEAEKLIRSIERTTTALMTICDTKSGAVVELTTKNVEVRGPQNCVCCATNHFRTEKLCIESEKVCHRYDILEKCQAGNAKLGVEDVAKELHAVNLGRFTIETMIFEPATRMLHLAYGPGPATLRPLTKLELKPLFEKGHGP
jgi:isopenicillin-N N-acyltransferase like protein